MHGAKLGGPVWPAVEQQQQQQHGVTALRCLQSSPGHSRQHTPTSAFPSQDRRGGRRGVSDCDSPKQVKEEEEQQERVLQGKAAQQGGETLLQPLLHLSAVPPGCSFPAGELRLWRAFGADPLITSSSSLCGGLRASQQSRSGESSVILDFYILAI